MVFPVLKHFRDLSDSLLLSLEICYHFFDREIPIPDNRCLLVYLGLKGLILSYLGLLFERIFEDFNFLLRWGRCIFIILTHQRK